MKKLSHWEIVQKKLFFCLIRFYSVWSRSRNILRYWHENTITSYVRKHLEIREWKSSSLGPMLIRVNLWPTTTMPFSGSSVELVIVRMFLNWARFLFSGLRVEIESRIIHSLAQKMIKDKRKQNKYVDCGLWEFVIRVEHKRFVCTKTRSIYNRLKCCRCNQSADECAANKLKFSPVNTLRIIIHSVRCSQGAKLHLCVKYKRNNRRKRSTSNEILFVFNYRMSSRRKKGQLMRSEHEMWGNKK